jgi:glycosyltransferase involved in cell wall biosynthesis
MHQISSYILYITIFFLFLHLLLGKLRLFSLIWLYRRQKTKSIANKPVPGISVIICSRNDLANLQHNLPSILLQDYPSFEVIVVDDASTDTTLPYLQELAKEHARLQVIHIATKVGNGKKNALQVGIANATYPFLLLTDADCMPGSNQWIKSYAGIAHKNNTLALGYGAYKKEKGFLNALIRFDTASIAIQYMSYTLWRRPYMGVGRNMGYSKDLAPAFSQVNTTLASGDDDLFVQAISKKAVFKVNLEKESFTFSTAKSSCKDWLQQKGRHTTTAPLYGLSTQIRLMVQWLISAGFYTGIICTFLTGNLYNGLILLLLYTLSTGLFKGLWINRLGEKDLILLTPLLDFIYTFVQPIFVFKSWGRKKDEWN